MRMIALGTWSRSLSIALFAAGLLTMSAARGAEDPLPSDSALVKLLKSGRVPEARQGTIIEMIGKRGTVGDLEYIYQQAMAGRFAPTMRIKSLDALAEAALTRDMKPGQDRDKLIALLPGSAPRGDAALEKSAVRLAGLWRLEAAADVLLTMVRSATTEEGLRASAIEALTAIGGRVGRSRIEELAGPSSPAGVRVLAVAALARLDVDAAAARAAELIPKVAGDGVDLKPLMAAFLNRQGAGAILAAAIERNPIPADAAKLCLRAVYSLSLADPALVGVLGRAAGIATEVKPPTPAELSALVAEVAAKGDPVRGEAVFRRADLNCMTCHALSKAGGDVGPDLSSIGQSSPSDYIILSILVPDQSIKEQYHTLVMLTSDGQVYQGIVTDKDNQRVVLKESTGALRVVPVSSIEDQKPGGSLMPKGLVSLMTHAEFVDLVRFLSELGRPGPYAIRTTPSIQRWRVLKEVSPALTESVPDLEVLRDRILAAAPDRWTTAYAKVAGSLPLGELDAAKPSKVLYIQGELSVSTGGRIRLRPDSPEGIRFWVDDVPAPAGTREFGCSVTPGRHTVTVRVEMAERPSHEVKIEVDKPDGSLAEFTVVGGK
jgi:putative heme-binding domain-containing protein